jgi:RND family efflux transporter MFP subunit
MKFIKNFSPKQIFLIIAGFLVILCTTILANFYISKKPDFKFVEAKKTDITQAIQLTGTVKAAQDLTLSFQKSGNVAAVLVSAGDKVKKGSILAKLDNKDAYAAVRQMQAAVEAAKANYNKVLNGATNPEIEVAKAAVATAQTNYDNAKINFDAVKAQQDVLVQNAYRNMLNANLVAVPTSEGTLVIPTISGSYNSDEQGQYNIKLYETSGDGMHFSVSGLETADGRAENVPRPLGTRGLYIQFPDTQLNIKDSWTVSIPNSLGAAYVANSNAYNASIQSREQALTVAQATVDAANSALKQAQAALALKQTPARQEDLALANAQIDAALAQLQSAQNILSNGYIISPIDGVITAVNAKTGEFIMPSVPLISIISQQKFQIEAYLSEADLSKVKVGNMAVVTLDSYGLTDKFAANVINIDPSATIIGSAKTYKITLQFTQDDERIKNNMAANITIFNEKHSNVLAVPNSSIFNAEDKKIVLIQSGNGQIEQKAVETGVTDLSGYTEITSGLQEGEKVIDLGK